MLLGLTKKVEIKSEKPAFSMQIDRQVSDADAFVTAAGSTGTDILKNIPSVDVDIDDNVTLRGNTQQYSSHYETDAFIQDYSRKRMTRFIRLNVRYRFGKMDPNLFERKKKQDETEESPEMEEKKPADNRL